jgi:hypothetical protein
LRDGGALVTTPRTQTESIALLRAAIDRSGLSVNEYARTVLVRDPRTCARWLAGEIPLPAAVLDFLRGDTP